MPDYVFGREVTVKLPEPDRVDGLRALWSGQAEHGIFWNVVARPGSFSATHDGVGTPCAREFGLALLAAADYAENGDTDER